MHKINIREDIEMIDEAEKLGWKVFVNKNDIRAGRNALDSNFSLSFEKGNLICWHCSKGWVVAEQIDTTYKNHNYHPTLKEALTKELKREYNG